MRFVSKFRMGIGAQVLAGALILVIAFSLSTLYTYFQVKKFEANYESLLAYASVQARDVQEVNTELWRQNAQVRAYVLTGEKSYTTSFQASQARVNELLESIESRIRTEDGMKELQILQLSINGYSRMQEQGISVRDKMGLDETIKFLKHTDGRAEMMEKLTQGFIKLIDDELISARNENAVRVVAMERNMLVLLAAIFLLASGAAFWLSRRISRPLSAIVRAADAIAAGDLAHNTFRYTGNDELADMLKAFDRMSENLRGLVAQVAKSAEQLAAASEQLTASAEQSAQSAGQVATTISEVAAGAASQVAAVEQSVSVTREMTSAIDGIASTVASVSKQSEAAANAAQSGDEAVARAAEQMDIINRSVSKTSEVVRTLDASSRQIDEIVGAITGIAGQTNLLALNAAIEAARAGEAGRGFAVVADEVRKLAEQSEEAARKIGSIIKEIQTDTEAAVSVMNEGSAEVARGTEVMAATGDRFREIAEQVRGLNRHIRDITGAASRLTQASGEVVQAVGSVKTVAADTAANTQTISAAAEEQSATIEQIAASSQSLSHMAGDLQKVISRFRL